MYTKEMNIKKLRICFLKVSRKWDNVDLSYSKTPDHFPSTFIFALSLKA